MLPAAIALYLAAIYLRPAEVVPALASLPVAQTISIVTGIVAIGAYLLDPQPLFNRSSDRYLLGFWVAIPISNLAWGWFDGAYQGFTNFLVVIFSYFLIRIGATTERRIRFIIGVLVVMCVLQAVNGIVEFHTGIGLGHVTMVQDNRIRGTGIFNDPNDLGMALVMVVPFLVAAVLESRWIGRIAAATALAPIMVAIYYTNSRGTALGVLVCIFVYFKSRVKGVIGPAIAAIALAAVVAAAPSRASDMSANEESAQGRIQAWSAGLVMLKTHPVFGVGYGRFTEFNELVAHNSFVHTFGELGLVGAFCFMGMWVSYFGGLTPASHSANPDSEPRSRLRRDLIASGLGTLTCAMFLSRQYDVVPYLILGLGTAFASLPPADGEADPAAAAPSALRVLTLTIAGIVLTRIVVLLLAHW